MGVTETDHTREIRELKEIRRNHRKKIIKACRDKSAYDYVAVYFTFEKDEEGELIEDGEGNLELRNWGYTGLEGNNSFIQSFEGRREIKMMADPFISHKRIKQEIDGLLFDLEERV